MKNKTAVIAAIIGGGCIVFSFLQVILIGGIMGGSAYLLNSCSRDMNEKIEQSEKILNRFTESGLPEVLELPDKTVIDQKFATEYMPCESAYDTKLMLRLTEKFLQRIILNASNITTKASNLVVRRNTLPATITTMTAFYSLHRRARKSAPKQRKICRNHRRKTIFLSGNTP